MTFFTIFNHLDAPKKFSGITMLEMLVVGSIVFCSFISGYLAPGLCIGALAFRVTRTLSRSVKINQWFRYLYFHYMDLKSGWAKSSRFFL